MSGLRTDKEVFLPAGGFLEAMDGRVVGQAALQLIILLQPPSTEITGMQLAHCRES